MCGCSGCTGGCNSCSGSCTGTDYGSCTQCAASCSTSCGTCSVACGGGCWGCVGGCEKGCMGCGDACTGCSGCTGSCQGCTSCTGSCQGCSGTCTGSCQGCTGSCQGCQGCTGTCSGACDNACTATNASETIANLGSNISFGKDIKVNDFISLRDSIHNEIVRRNQNPPSDTFTITPAAGVKVLVEHAQKEFDDCKFLDNSKNWVVNNGQTIKSSELQSSIDYIKALMSQNTKS